MVPQFLADVRGDASTRYGAAAAWAERETGQRPGTETSPPRALSCLGLDVAGSGAGQGGSASTAGVTTRFCWQRTAGVVASLEDLALRSWQGAGRLVGKPCSRAVIGSRPDQPEECGRPLRPGRQHRLLSEA